MAKFSFIISTEPENFNLGEGILIWAEEWEIMFKIGSFPPISIELEHMELDNNLIENNHEECSYHPFSQFNENSINNQDSHSQIENDETPGAEYPNENDSEDTE